MSTLNLPAIIARLHGIEQCKPSIPSSRKRIVKHADVTHFGPGDRNWATLQKTPLYLDQVLRRRRDVQPHDNRYADKPPPRNKRPHFLPKLDSRPVYVSDTTVPIVKGTNVENTTDFETSKAIVSSVIHDDDDDDDSQWARNAINGTDSKDIVRSYEDHIPSSTTALEETRNDKVAHNHRKTVTFSKLYLLPPLEKTPTKVDGHYDQPSAANHKLMVNNDRHSRDNVSEHASQQLPKMMTLARQRNSTNSATNLPSDGIAKRSGVVQITRRSNGSLLNGERERRSLRNEIPASQSTFSRILHPESPTTHAGRKLLASLLSRTQKAKKSTPLLINNIPGPVLYAEEYLRVAEGVGHQSETAFGRAGKPSQNRVPHNKFPGETVGKHFQQTHNNLWKYIFTDGSTRSGRGAMSYFPTKRELQKTNPDVVYIPTGRPEDALSVEKMKPDSEMVLANPVKLKYMHRHGEEEQEVDRSKDTSPWDIDEQLRTPETVGVTLNQQAMGKRETLVLHASIDEHNNFYEDGIRRLRITLPLPEIIAPPSSPISSNCTMLNSASIATKSNFSNLETYNQAQNRHIQPSHYIAAPVKVIDFKKNKADGSKGEGITARSTKSKKSKGPVAIPKPEGLSKSKTASQTGPASKKTRLYAHGQYFVKVEDTLIRKRKVKMPKDLNNMFTRPYTFSYLTGVQAPCKLTSKLNLPPGVRPVANISLAKKDNSDTNLVSEVRKIDNSIDSNIPEMTDASTQFDASDASEGYLDTSTEEIEMNSINRDSSDKHHGEDPDLSVLTKAIYSSKQPIKNSRAEYSGDELDSNLNSCRPTSPGNLIKREISRDDETEMCFLKTPPSIRVRNCVWQPINPHQLMIALQPLSEGAKEADVRDYRQKVKDFDSSKLKSQESDIP